MTLDEARRELGIDASATPEEARRAYLRGIKVRKPETDPQGFRRLREAYELLAEARETREESQGVPFAEIEEAQAPPELRALVARIEEIPAETHLEERLAALRKGIAEFPASAGLRWWLIQELDRAEHYGELLEVLRQAEADGLPGFLETRALNYSDSLEADDLARLEASGHPAILAVAAQAHLRRSRPEEAIVILRRAIDRLAEVDPRTLQPFPVWLPQSLLGLEAAGRPAEARFLHERLWAWLSGTGDAAVIERWGQEFQWLVVHELSLLDLGFPAELRRAAAFAALNGERESAVHAARGFIERHPGRAGLAAQMLSGLPILHDLYFATLQSAIPAPQLRPRKPSAGKTGPGWGTSFFLILGLIRIVAWVFSSDSDVVAHQPPLPPQQVLAQSADDAWQVLSEPCDKPPRPFPLDACNDAKQAVQSAKAGDCAGAHQALGAMESHLQDASAVVLATGERFKNRLVRSLPMVCSSPGNDRPR